MSKREFPINLTVNNPLTCSIFIENDGPAIYFPPGIDGITTESGIFITTETGDVLTTET